MTPARILQINRSRVTVDRLSNLKGRIAEAFVESIFRRAGYRVSRAGRESLKGEFLPDFLVRRAVDRPDGQRTLHQLVPVEVRYRRKLGVFLQERGAALVKRLAPHWPDLCFVFVTDEPDEGRSCFQVLDLGADGVRTVDLHEVTELDIFRTTVQEYEALVRQVFVLLEWHAKHAPTRRVGVASRASTAERPAVTGRV
jgi:hypothetical protein